MTVLVFGRTGQVGSELAHHPGVTALDRRQADLRDPQTCASMVETSKPRGVIIAAAYTAVDRAEAEEAEALTINAETPGAIARAAAAKAIPLVYISTDYVFPGTGSQPWYPDSATGPLGAYGRTKLAGEQNVRAAGGSFAILRTSWVFSAHGSNFVKTMLRLSEERDELAVVDDQIGGPTPARSIAAACLAVLTNLEDDPAKSGIYHFSGCPEVSWHRFACRIMELAGRNTAVRAIGSDEFPTPAKRPRNSRLDCTSLTETFGLSRPDWEDGLVDVLKELEDNP